MDGRQKISEHKVSMLYWAVMLVLLALIVNNPFRINEDCALRLQLAQWIIEGKLPYVDFVDVTPPAATYLSLVPVIISKLLSINVIFVFSITVVLVVAWSALMVRKIVSRSGKLIDSTELDFMLFGWALFSLLIYKRGYFGEREHIFVLLFLPLLVVRWLRTQNGTIAPLTALIVGFAAGIGTCVKPHFVLVALMPEIYWLLQARKPGLLKPELVMYVCTGAVFLMHFFLLPGQVTTNMFGRWLPFILERYDVYNCDFVHLVIRKDFLFTLVAVVGPFLIKPVPTGGLGGLLRPLSLSVVGAILAFMIQHKGFSYQLFPAVGLAAVGTIIMSYELMKPKLLGIKGFHEGVVRLTKVVCTLIFSLSVVFLVAMTVWTILNRPQYSPSTSVAQIISEYSKSQDSILIISPSVGDSYPMLLQLGRKPGTRFANFFWIGMLYKGVKMAPNSQFPYRSEAQAPPEEKVLLDELAEDIHTFRPTLILIPNESYCHGCPKGFNIVQYLEKSGFMAREMARYALLSTVPNFNIYIRIDNSIAPPRTGISFFTTCID